MRSSRNSAGESGGELVKYSSSRLNAIGKTYFAKASHLMVVGGHEHLVLEGLRMALNKADINVSLAGYKTNEMSVDITD